MVTFTNGNDKVSPFDLFFLDDEVDDDFYALIPTYDDDNVDDGYCFSVEQEEDMSRRPIECPKETELDDVPLDVLKDVTVTIDRAREQVFNEEKRDIDMLQKGWGEKSPEFEKLAAKIVGRKSRLFHTMMEELHILYPTYCRCLATLYAACHHKMPVFQLLNEKNYNKKELLSLNEFNKILRSIEMISGGVVGNTSGEPLWMKIEDTCNKEGKDAFLKHCGTSRLTIRFDDDKEK